LYCVSLQDVHFKKIEKVLCFPFQALASSFQRTFILFSQPPLAAVFLVIGSAKVLQFFILTSFLKKNIYLFFLGTLNLEFKPSLLSLQACLKPVNLFYPTSLVR